MVIYVTVLVVGSLAIQEGMKELYPDQAIDRTNLSILSKPSPYLTDVVSYLTGGRYQFYTFYVAIDFEGLYILQRLDNLKTIFIALNDGIKPTAIDSLGTLAVQQKLAPCDINHLRELEDDFTGTLLELEPIRLFNIKTIADFECNPSTKMITSRLML